MEEHPKKTMQELQNLGMKRFDSKVCSGKTQTMRIPG